MEEKLRKRNLFLPNQGIRTFYGRTYTSTLKHFFYEYIKDTQWSQSPGVRSYFWKELNLACYHGNKEIIEFIMEHPNEINVNNRRNDSHLNLLGSAFFGGKEWVVLRLLEHPKLDINRHVLAGYHYMVNNKLLHPLVQAARKNMKKVVEKILAHPAFDVNNLSRNFHWSRSQMDIHGDSPDTNDINTGKISILEELLYMKKHNYIVKQLLDRDNVKLNERMYIETAIGNNREALEWLCEKEPLLCEKTEDCTEKDCFVKRWECFEKAVKYGAESIVDYFQETTQDEEFSRLMNGCSSQILFYIEYGDILYSQEKAFSFFQRFYNYLSEEQRNHCLEVAYTRSYEDFLVLCFQKNMYSLGMFNRYDPSDHGRSLRQKVLPEVVENKLFRLAQEIVKILFEKPQSLLYYQKLLCKLYTNIIEGGNPIFHEEDLYRSQRNLLVWEKRQNEKHFIYYLNSLCLQQYRTSITAFSELKLFQRGLPILPTDVQHHILKFIDKKWFLTKTDFSHFNWIHYAVAQTDEYEDEV